MIMMIFKNNTRGPEIKFFLCTYGKWKWKRTVKSDIYYMQWCQGLHLLFHIMSTMDIHTTDMAWELQVIR